MLQENTEIDNSHFFLNGTKKEKKNEKKKEGESSSLKLNFLLRKRPATEIKG